METRSQAAHALSLSLSDAVLTFHSIDNRTSSSPSDGAVEVGAPFLIQGALQAVCDSACGRWTMPGSYHFHSRVLDTLSAVA